MANAEIFAISFVLLMIDRVHSYKSRLQDGPPVEYKIHLQVLNVSLSMNSYWSAFFSEKLDKNNSLKQPDEEFCMPLMDPNSIHIDTFETIKLIVDKCSHSGMYIEYGVKLLSQSVQCFFYRIARLHMAAMNNKLYDSNDEFEKFVTNLLVDYRLITDKFTVVRAPLKKFLELIVYIHDIAYILSKYPGDTIPLDVKEKITKVSKKLLMRIDEDFKMCAIKTTNWHDDKRNRILNLEGLTNDIVPDDNAENVTSENIPSSSEAQAMDSVVSKADDLRKVMTSVFENMFVREMPSEVWNDVFIANILFKESDVQNFINNSPKLQNKVQEYNFEEEEEEEDNENIDIEIEYI